MDGRTLLKRLRDDKWYLGDTEGACRQYVHPERPGVITVCVRHTEVLGPAALEQAFDPAEHDIAEEPEVVVESTAAGASAFAEGLPGCVATGADEAEARERLQAALELHRQALRELAE